MIIRLMIWKENLLGGLEGGGGRNPLHLEKTNDHTRMDSSYWLARSENGKPNLHLAHIKGYNI